MFSRNMFWQSRASDHIPDSLNLNDRSQSNRSEDDERLITESYRPTQSSESRGLVATYIVQVFFFLWIPLVLTFVVFNFKNHIVGATLWCLGKHCHVELFNPIISVPVANLERFDKRDHDILGAMQLLAKAVEIWFGFIATALVALITFKIAEKSKGLPIGLITNPFGFADLLGLFDTAPLFWTSKRFVLFTSVLCILCNFMGPAIAVLIIPHLRWIDTEKIGDRTFQSLGASHPPSTDLTSYFWSNTNCSKQDFELKSFSCAANTYDSKLDAWISTYIAAGNSVDGLTQEWNVKFRINQTFAITSPHSAEGEEFSASTWWTPSRQLLSSLDDDLTMIKQMSLGFSDEDLDEFYGDSTENFVLIDRPDTYHQYIDTIHLNLERNGPILGAIVQMHFAHGDDLVWTTKIDENRSVRCFGQYDLSDSPLYLDSAQGMYTKCVRLGKGWGTNNKEAHFTIAGEHNSTTNLTGPNVEISITSSDRAQFFEDGEFPAWLPTECLQRGQVPSTVDCDWDALFDTDPNARLYNRTQNVVTIEMNATDTSADDPEHESFQLTVDFVTFLSFTNYSLDASPLTNPTVLATTQDLPLNGTSIHVDPAWMLAAWTADNNGTLASDRTATLETVRILNRYRTFDVDTALLLRANYISLLPVVQALSMVDFTTKTHGSVKAAEEAAKTGNHPRLTRRAHIYVWAYGVDSRTAKFGVTVVFLGIIIVLIQVVLGFVDRRKCGSLMQLLVSALEHVDTRNFNSTGGDERRVARTRFRVDGPMEGVRKYLFSQV